MVADSYVTKSQLDEAIAASETRILAAMGDMFAYALQMISERFDRLEERMDRIEDKLDRTAAIIDLYSVDIRQLKRKLA